MSHTTFGYTLFTAGFGMLIVFFFLALLSVLMVLIKRIFDERTKEAPASAPPSPAVQTVAETAPPSWVIAGVVAYLAIEERLAARPAAPWTQRRVDA